jgi:formylglycine-generating enzyme required for sulfatase activity
MNRFLLPPYFLGALVCALHFAPPVASAVTIDWVTVGDPGNVDDTADGSAISSIDHYGGVDYSYRIAKYDVTNSQYVEFLNSNDPGGVNKLALYNPEMTTSKYGGIALDPAAAIGVKYSTIPARAQKPVNFVSWFDAIRFANWLENGQAPGSTESGTYTLLNGAFPSNGDTITRAAGATIFLPSDDEWYKAAYYNSATKLYFQYATSSNTPPTSSAPTPLPNHANFEGNPGDLTDVGAYTGSASPYGAFDMGGNVWQWVEGVPGPFRPSRGGAWDWGLGTLLVSGQYYNFPSREDRDFGFRVAAVIPEPSTGVMAAIGCCLLGLLRKRFKRKNSAVLPLALLVALLGGPPAASAVTIDWSFVGNPDNAADSTGYGAVGYSYNIGTYDVTNSQYVAFLNSNVPDGEIADPLALYNSNMSNATYGGITYNSGAASGSKYSVISGKGDYPANYVTFYNALRFANWLNNGQVPGSTEMGAYTLLGGTALPSNANSITRNAGATVFLPSENEWYKAAYYDPTLNSGAGGYYKFPTSSNTAPAATDPSGTPNSANFWPGGPRNLTAVGAYSGTTSPSGAYDMGGNVWQWNEALISGTYRGSRGGGFISDSIELRSSNRNYGTPTGEGRTVGFRVASVVIPEPSTGVMAGIGCCLLGLLRKRFKRKNSAVLPLALFIALLGGPLSASAVTIDWVHVGNAGNAADPLTGFGAVGHSYQISKYEVTNRQYVEFLNSNDPTGKNELRLFSDSLIDGSTSGGIQYHQGAAPGKHYLMLAGLEERPVVEVSWYSAIRFANWLITDRCQAALRQALTI